MGKQIAIELVSRQLFLKSGSQTLTQYPVAIGKPTTPTPNGDFTILNMYKYPGGVLGTRWLGFTPEQHGIHGTNQPQSIGKAVSLGCVRMYNHHVEELYRQVNVGIPIIIRHNFSTTQPDGKQSKYIYSVRPGDSLWLISRKYGVTVEALMKLNNLHDTLIYPGQQLKIPHQHT